MSFELFFARTWIVFVAASVVTVDFIAAKIAWNYFRDWRDGVLRGKGFDISTNVWVALTVSSALTLIGAAIMDVGQAFVLVSESAEKLAWLYGAMLGPSMIYKGWTKGKAIQAGGKNGDGDG